MRPLDANEAQEYAALMRQARDITADVDIDPAEVALIEDQFDRFVRDLGVTGSLGRELNDDGLMVWTLRIDAGRGRIMRVIADPRDWRQEVGDLGLD